MITNKFFTHGVSIIDVIRQSRIPFHLTGSKFFGNETQESDWDFFVSGESDIKITLKSWGFIQQGNYYGSQIPDSDGIILGKPDEFKMDPCIESVWEHNQLDSERVHVLVIKPEMMWVKLDAQEIIKSQNLMSLAPRYGKLGVAPTDYKALSRAIWISVMKAVIVV